MEASEPHIDLGFPQPVQNIVMTALYLGDFPDTPKLTINRRIHEA